MFDDDDYFLDPEEMAEDVQPTILDLGKTKMLEKMKTVVEDMLVNLKLSEHGDANSNLQILANDMQILVNLFQIDEDASDEEMQEAVDAAMKSATEITYSNINQVLREETNDSLDTTNEADSQSAQDDESGFDF